MVPRAIVTAVMMALVSTCALAADVSGAKEPDFLKRYEGSEIVNFESRSYDTYQIAGVDPKNPTSYAFTGLEGQVTRIVYRTPPGHTVLELLRNYEQALSDAGFQKTYEKMPFQDQNFGSLFYHQSWEAMADYMWSYLGLGGVQQMAYVTAAGTHNGQDIKVAVYIQDYSAPHDINYGKPVHFDPGNITVVVDLVSSKAVVNAMVVVKAADMASALATKGFVDLYGIYFDTDKTDVKPQSIPTLDEVASLLQHNGALKLEISGHTDSTGSKPHNQKLSEGRALAVVKVLVTRYAIAPARLVARGYGDTRPVATNATEDGKAKNRRVELRKI